jgi:sortase (surface protein transpeptidase)
MIKFNICKKMEYISRGEKKTFWEKVGTMTEFEKEDGSVSRVIEIPAIGLKAGVFEERKNARVESNVEKKSEDKIKEIGVDEEINPEDLPF